MRLPAGLYKEVIRRNNLLASIKRFIEIRSFLATTDLFSEGLPIAVRRRITDSATEQLYDIDTVLDDGDQNFISVIRSGRVERSVGSKVIDILKDRDCFGDDRAVLNLPSLYTLRAIEETRVVQIPGHLVGAVPILRWKIIENVQQRTAHLVRSDNQTQAVIWNTAFSIHVSQMDHHHKQLFEIANKIAEYLQNNSGQKSLTKAFETLIDYTRYHFEAEEKLMQLYRYQEIVQHTKVHKDLLRHVVEYMELLQRGNIPTKVSFITFMEHWMVRHILDEDRKYGEFLNEKGVF
jgi:hemerythrin